MKRVLLALALSLALPAASAASINTAYRVVGDPGAGVVQVFDDGQALYVQLRDVTRVPAPFVDGQPAQYVIRGQYIVLPLIPSVELRHGNDVVRVTRAGLPGGAQAQVFRSVDALDPAVALPAAPAPAAATSSGFQPVAAAQPERRVRGEIAVAGDRARPLSAGEPPAAPSSLAAASWAHGTQATRTLFSSATGKPVRVKADGTVRGAREAERLRAVCTVSGPTKCEIAYRGAPAGTTTMEIL